MSDFPDSTPLEGQGQEALTFEPSDLLPPSKHLPVLLAIENNVSLKQLKYLITISLAYFQALSRMECATNRACRAAYVNLIVPRDNKNYFRRP
jgi:hypothetical protein